VPAALNHSVGGVYATTHSVPCRRFWVPLERAGILIHHTFDTTVFNTVSAQQLSQNFRTFPSQFNNLRVDHTNNIDFTLTKTFRIGERVKVQFRAESFLAPSRRRPTTRATSSSDCG
jgi:hypothetical protein